VTETQAPRRIRSRSDGGGPPSAWAREAWYPVFAVLDYTDGTSRSQRTPPLGGLKISRKKALSITAVAIFNLVESPPPHLSSFIKEIPPLDGSPLLAHVTYGGECGRQKATLERQLRVAAAVASPRDPSCS